MRVIDASGSVRRIVVAAEPESPVGAALATESGICEAVSGCS
jgi:hypothetical protein